MPTLKEYGEQAGEMEVFPEFGIDGYSHLFIIACFDRLGRNRSDSASESKRLLNRGFRLAVPCSTFSRYAAEIAAA
jgi:hypothetical protein